MLKNLIVLGCLISPLLQNFLWADANFDHLREDRYVPSYCRDFGLSNFQEVNEWFVYGIEGYERHGFDFEYPLERQEATWLWEAFKKGKEPSNWPSQLANEVKLIKQYKEPMDFEFGSEGEVLELLALIDLETRFPRRDYFLTGGLVYHKAGGRVIGELDLLVGDIKTCEIVAVGEAKLGVSGLNKAKEQLNRFRGFLNSHSLLDTNFFSLPHQ